MEFATVFLLALGLSMDAFAVSLCCGATSKQTKLKTAITLGLAFGFFQGVMPLIGYGVGSIFAKQIESFDHWIAFVLLAVIGGKMLFEAFEDDSCDSGIDVSKFIVVLGLSLATSIDALIAGLSLAFLDMHPLLACLIIGVITAIMSFSGVLMGDRFSHKLGSKAEIAGGLVLIGLGLKTLLEHTVFA